MCLDGWAHTCYNSATPKYPIYKLELKQIYHNNRSLSIRKGGLYATITNYRCGYLDVHTVAVTQFIVEGLLPEGLHILAGSPKIGKSWLALWICLRVSKGVPVWDLSTMRGTVLYLCLEDSYARIQNRLFQITSDAPDTLHFTNLSGSIGDGLENQITAFLAVHPDTNLIVIDTLQKIRDIVPDSNSYASDYRDLSMLKNLADKHHIAILLVHHLRKMKDDDPMNMISGTTGISGATDSNFVLKRKDRNSPRAELHCTGRDIESRVLELSFQKETHTWVLSEPLEREKVSADPELLSLSAFLKQLHTFTGTATELSTLLEHKTGEIVSPSALSKRLAKHTSELEKSGIHVSSSRTRTARQIYISCGSCDGSDGSDGKNG